MKHQYERCDGKSARRHAGKYRHRWACQFRSVATIRELRQLIGDETDGHQVRRRRLNVPTAYDDLGVGRNYGRSWKDFTRRRHQWNDR